MARTVNYGGLVVAGIGFFLTRFTVTLAIYEDPIRFIFAGVLPLSLGLGLAAFGVGLAVVDVAPATVRTTALWCIAGAVTMFGLVFITLLGSTPGGGLPDLETMRSQAYLSNFLIGGSVGGTLTGLYAARNRRHRDEIQRQANRLKVLNRLLRHEVLNAVTVIQAYNSVEADADDKPREVIGKQSGAIERTIEEVKHLTRRTDPTVQARGTVDLVAALQSSRQTIADRYPDLDLEVEGAPESLPVRATPRLERAFTHLLENAIDRAEGAAPTVAVETTPTSARVSVTHGGGLSESERHLLETGEIEQYDDPRTGFALNLVRLYIEDLDGAIETDSQPDGSTVTIVLTRAEPEDAADRPLPIDVSHVRPAIPNLVVTGVAALIAGVFYGIASRALGGSIAGIGVFYGTPSPVVGWITHEFHSVVFAFVYAGLLSVAPERIRGSVLGYLGVGLAWALVLWTLAAGVIAPIWLNLLGIPASIPNLTGRLLVSHLAWGLSLGLLTAGGYAYLTPHVAGVLDRLRAGTETAEGRRS